uniref:MaoC-like domain-containing protein n=1 Tax=Ciona intestinalis TaxID=7719 RepID=H2XTC8_CIOIN
NVEVGQTVTQTRIFTSADVADFARLTGDSNPLHIDPNFARDSVAFNAPIVHGALINGFVSGILGMTLPGPGTVAFSLTLKFPNPLYINEAVKAKISIESVKKRFVECDIECTADSKAVMTGRAVVMVTNKSGS